GAVRRVGELHDVVDARAVESLGGEYVLARIEQAPPRAVTTRGFRVGAHEHGTVDGFAHPCESGYGPPPRGRTYSWLRSESRSHSSSLPSRGRCSSGTRARRATSTPCTTTTRLR